MNARLEFIPAIITAARPPSEEPSIGVGFLADSPAGPCVAIGCAATLPGKPGLAFIAHLHPNDADELISKLMDARNKAWAALKGSPELQIPEKLAEAVAGAVLDQGRMPDGPMAFGSALNKDGGIEYAAPLAPDDDARLLGFDVAGLQIQVQREGAAEPCHEPGIIAFSVQQVPGDARPVLSVILKHSDGECLIGFLEAEQIDPTMRLFGLALDNFQAIQAGGAPEGVRPS